MNYTCEIEIEKPVDEVVGLFDNVDNMYEWMIGLESFEHLSGTPSEPGAKSKLRFKMGKREMEMVETITSKNLPEEFSGTYEADGTLNIVKNSFVPVGEDRTKWVAEHEFQFGTTGMKIMGFFMPWAFKRQTMKYLQSFKDFAESESPPA